MTKTKDKAGDRPRMDMSGTQGEPQPGDTVLDKQKASDKKVTKGRHLDKGLNAAVKNVDTIKKALAYGKASDDDEVKAAILSEVADLGNEIRDESRKALRDAKNETRNGQDEAPK